MIQSIICENLNGKITRPTKMSIKTKIISLHGFAFTGTFLLYSIILKHISFIISLTLIFAVLLFIEVRTKNRKTSMRNYLYFDDIISISAIFPMLYCYSKAIESKSFIDNLYLIFFLCALIFLIALLSFIKIYKNE